MNDAKLLNILDALIDTAERTTSLNYVYNDTVGDAFLWDHVRQAREKLANEIFDDEGDFR